MAALIPSAAATGTGTMTLQGPNTNSTQTITIPDTTGTMMVSGNMPAFSAYSTATQSMGNNVATKIQYNNKEFDTNNCFDATTNYRFTPTVAGYYIFTAQCNYSASAVNSRFLNIYKNGSSVKQTTLTGLNSLNYSNVQITNILYMNGSTDYVEIYASQNSGGTLTTSGNQMEVWFTGALVRAA